ncbi:mitogen-activated protein kinase kinase kinase [Sarracenia purpurea var. burkii]
MAQNHEKRVGFDNNQNTQLEYEEITRILGLQRMNSECDSDIAEFASAKASIDGAYTNQAYGYQKENSDRVHGPRRVTGEANLDPDAARPSASTFNEFESSQFCQPRGFGVPHGYQSGKMKFLCSFGGKILPRPSDGKLRYVGGDTRIISIRNNLSWEELVKKTSGICKQPHTIKYQLPGEDLDALISVSSFEDLQNMIEEYQGLEKLGGSQRLRIFLIPLSESENTRPLDTITIQQSNPNYQYVVAVNGIVDSSPQRNSEPILESAASRLKTNLESVHTLGDSHPTQYINEFQSLVWSPVQSTPVSLEPGLQGDSRSIHAQLYKDNLFSGSTESSSTFITAQLPPENSSNDVANYYSPAHGADIPMNCHVPNKVDNLKQPGKPGGVQFHNFIPSRDFLVPPSFDKKDGNVDEYSCRSPMLKEKTFQFEKPISHFEDPTGRLSASNDSIDFQHGTPHMLSDSHMNFSKPQLSSVVVSASLQEEPLQLPDNIDLINPQVQIPLLNVDATVSHKRADLLNCSVGLQPLGRNEYTREGADYTDEKYQLTKAVKTDNFMLQNHNEENPLTYGILNGFDKEDPFLKRDSSKLSKGGPPASSSMKHSNKYPSISCDPISNLGVNTPSQELQVSVGMVPALSGTGLKPFADKVIVHPQSIQQEKAPAEPLAKGQRTAKDQWLGSTARTGDEHESRLSWANHLEATGMLPDSKQHFDENSPTDLMGGLTDGLVSRESSQLLPGACQNNTGLQESTQKSSFRREVSLIDDDFLNPDQKVAKSGILKCLSEKQMLDDISLSKYNEQNQLDSMVIAERVADSLFPAMDSYSATIPRVVDETGGEILSSEAMDGERLPMYESENDKADDGDNGESITDAVIAEMEADIYGLQIIKNADLEDLRELGSGTYGTVYHGKWRGTDVAIKRIKNSCFAGRSSEQERLTKDFWREACILSNLHHPNVVAFYGVVPDGAGGTLATVTEFMANGSLRNVLLKKDRSLDRRRKLIVAMDAAFGMEYLHSKNIVHFDLKCDNLLVNLRDPQRPICKVGDFGLSRIKRNTLVSGGVRGTLPWMAPELLNGSSSRVSEKVDVFSFGIAMWEILTGEEPYTNMHCGAIIGKLVMIRKSHPDCGKNYWNETIL